MAQEFAPIAGVILPSIFAVEKQTDGQRLLARHAFAEKTQAAVQVRGGGFAIHAAVDEADEVREMVIAEQSGDGTSRQLHTIGIVQTIEVCRQTGGVVT